MIGITFSQLKCYYVIYLQKVPKIKHMVSFTKAISIWQVISRFCVIVKSESCLMKFPFAGLK